MEIGQFGFGPSDWMPMVSLVLKRLRQLRTVSQQGTLGYVSLLSETLCNFSLQCV